MDTAIEECHFCQRSLGEDGEFSSLSFHRLTNFDDICICELCNESAKLKIIEHEREYNNLLTSIRSYYMIKSKKRNLDYIHSPKTNVPAPRFKYHWVDELYKKIENGKLRDADGFLNGRGVERLYRNLLQQRSHAIECCDPEISTDDEIKKFVEELIYISFYLDDFQDVDFWDYEETCMECCKTVKLRNHPNDMPRYFGETHVICGKCGDQKKVRNKYQYAANLSILNDERETIDERIAQIESKSGYQSIEDYKKLDHLKGRRFDLTTHGYILRTLSYALGFLLVFIVLYLSTKMN